jgi:hypothetical protein
LEETGLFLRFTIVPMKRDASSPASHTPSSVSGSQARLSFDRARERLKHLTPTERLRLEKLLSATRSEAKKAARKVAPIIPFATEGSA